MRFLRTGLVLVVMHMMATQVPSADEPRPNSEDAKLAGFFQDYLQQLFRRQPLSATRLGEHAFDDQLDDLTPEARSSTLQFKRQVLTRLPREIDATRLSGDGLIDFQI
ncbi:MAG: hypothetical protein JO161_00330, partial [Planctomycetaceae bacterium]|nr:hypothetical protein [Planctomycetaceae bacterium]